MADLVLGGLFVASIAFVILFCICFTAMGSVFLIVRFFENAFQKVMTPKIAME